MEVDWKKNTDSSSVLTLHIGSLNHCSRRNSFFHKYNLYSSRSSSCSVFFLEGTLCAWSVAHPKTRRRLVTTYEPMQGRWSALLPSYPANTKRDGPCSAGEDAAETRYKVSLLINMGRYSQMNNIKWNDSLWSGCGLVPQGADWSPSLCLTPSPHTQGPTPRLTISVFLTHGTLWFSSRKLHQLDVTLKVFKINFK